jgi:thiol-disulfide isomerase/thioredoxin
MATLQTRALVEPDMKNLIAIFTAIALILLSVDNSIAKQKTTVFQAFNPQTFVQIKQQYYGQKWLIILWSVECPPCMKELALVKKLQQEKENLAVVIINVDTGEEYEVKRQEIIAHFQLTQVTQLYFRDGFEAHSRYLIDPQWFGELPRSYFIDEAGVFHGKSGLVDKVILSKWLLT